tara:strand:- start:364 stop:582 length:219 start_codon:yes stop_codon:yes gene_type:complete
MELQKGDLIYIPQDVYLYGEDLKYRTSKPQTGLYIDETAHNFMMQVLVDGIKMNVRKNHVYPLKKKEEDSVS